MPALVSSAVCHSCPLSHRCRMGPSWPALASSVLWLLSSSRQASVDIPFNRLHVTSYQEEKVSVTADCPMKEGRRYHSDSLPHKSKTKEALHCMFSRYRWMACVWDPTPRLPTVWVGKVLSILLQRNCHHILVFLRLKLLVLWVVWPFGSSFSSYCLLSEAKHPSSQSPSSCPAKQDF